MNKPTCPLCSCIVSASPLKSWKYKVFEVKRYECNKCKSKFNHYQSPKKTFTIPKQK